MWNGVMGDWEWNLSQWFVAIEGDWGGNNYTNCFFGELTASAPQPAEMQILIISSHIKLLYNVRDILPFLQAFGDQELALVKR